MRVLHVINSLDIGGAEKLLTDMLPILEEEISVDLLLLDATKTQFYRDLEERLKNVRILRVKKRSIYNPLQILSIAQYVRSYDIIHVHLFPALYWSAIAKLFLPKDAKFVFTEHSTNNRRLQNMFFKFIDRFIYSQYKKIICITPSVKAVLENKLRIPSNKLEVIQNGVDLNKIEGSSSASRSEFSYLDTDKLIVMVAGFRVEKDHSTVVKALSLLPFHFKLIFIGAGPKTNEVRDLVRELNLQNRVQFLGVRGDVYSLLKMSDLGVLSSHWEGFGLAAVESMACGLPTIASDVNGLRQVVEGGGMLFQPGDYKNLAKLIISISSTPTMYRNLSTKGILKSKKYGLDKMAAKHLLVYNSIR